MSGDQELRSILASVPGIDPDNAIVEPLGGGLTNFTVRVRQAGADWVLRVEFGQSVLKPASAGQEVEIQNEAASAGLAPAIVYTDAGRRILVTEYLDGRSWGSADLHDPRKLELLAGVLRRVHALPWTGEPVDLAAVAREYASRLDAEPDIRAFADHCSDVVGNAPTCDGPVCCHNDIVAGNVIEFDGLRLIDWEFAGGNDPYFDLASAIAYHDLDADLERTLLAAYCDGAGPADRERLELAMRTYDALQWLWFALRQAQSPEAWQRQRLDELARRIG